MDRLHTLTQPLLVIGLIALTFALFFFPVPQANAEYFKTAVTAIISFISGVSIATAAVKAATPNKEGAASAAPGNATPEQEQTP